METQSTQGLMQLLGAVQANQGSSMSRRAGTPAPDELMASGFSDILAGLQPGALNADLANSLPLTGQGLPPAELGNSVHWDGDVGDEANLGFYAQSLVSGLLSSQGGRNSSLSAGNGLANGSNTSAGSLKKEAASSLNLSSTALGVDAEMDLGSPLDAQARRLNDRFLGAAGSSGTLGSADSLGLSLASSASATTETTTAGSAQLLSSPLVALQAETALLAANSSEDPVTQSLQDLHHLEDGEKAELENKLILGERKQDEQVLKLSKSQQAWGDALSERISMNAAKNMKQVTIHLDPPELGSLELKMQVKDDQQTQIQVHVQNPQVKEALESSAQRLRDMLASQGLQLSEFDVQADSGQGQQHNGHDSEAEEGLAQVGQQDSDALAMAGEEISVGVNLPKNNNLLDTFV